MGMNWMDEPASVARAEAARAGTDIGVRVPKGVELEEDARQIYEEMVQGTRSWGRAMLLLGVIHLLVSGFLSAPWGILLLVVGLASFVFREASMFVIYGVTMGWAALSNFLSGETAWIVFGLLQVYWAYGLFRRFFRYRRAVEAYADTETIDSPLQQRAARVFPWVGFVLGGAALSGVVLVVIGLLVLGMSGVQEVPGYVGFVIGLVENVAILGVAVCLASLLTRYENKIPAALGLAGSLAVVILIVVLMVI